MKTKIRTLALYLVLGGIFVLALAPTALAHDGWVQSNAPMVRVGDMSYLDLQFGNHGNTHRDYKLYGTWNPSNPDFSFTLHSPSGQQSDLKDSLVNLGTPPGGTPLNLGYLTTSFKAQEAGYYIADVRDTSIQGYCTCRSIKGAKSIVMSVGNGPNFVGQVIKPLLNRAGLNKNHDPGFARNLGQPLEIIPLTDPAAARENGQMTLQVLYQGQPLQDAHVSMIPRSNIPPAEMGEPYDLMTDMEGKVTFDLMGPDYYLFNVHYEDHMQAGDGYNYTKYGSLLSVIVTPQNGPGHMDIGQLPPLSSAWQMFAVAAVATAGIMGVRKWRAKVGGR